MDQSCGPDVALVALVASLVALAASAALEIFVFHPDVTFPQTNNLLCPSTMTVCVRVKGFALSSCERRLVLVDVAVAMVKITSLLFGRCPA